ncbi:uncharacterized protein LOC120352410 isoform X2 [Nilaparvata lugens]|uniref:uncharacterized protein LOC120352410 isoform X2 n=1 Tax=Nilaparvata lugens TaxID=108931 RepID=UPI00193CAC1F|nr:uncharacterized protein LOC120352410 isoform X2 [Nilaparvata lugens]
MEKDTLQPEALTAILHFAGRLFCRFSGCSPSGSVRRPSNGSCSVFWYSTGAGSRETAGQFCRLVCSWPKKTSILRKHIAFQALKCVTKAANTVHRVCCCSFCKDSEHAIP